jgi:hypothetical protein
MEKQMDGLPLIKALAATYLRRHGTQNRLSAILNISPSTFSSVKMGRRTLLVLPDEGLKKLSDWLREEGDKCLSPEAKRILNEVLEQPHGSVSAAFAEAIEDPERRDKICHAIIESSNMDENDTTESKDKTRATPIWYVSYSNDSEVTHRNPVAKFCGRLTSKGISVRRDTEILRYGDSIEDFMRELATADRILIWLTRDYLESPYCMFELHETWRVSEEFGKRKPSAETDFDNRVVVVLGDTPIRLETEIGHYRQFWKKQMDAISEEIAHAYQIDELTLRKRNMIARFCYDTGPILRYISDRVHHRSFDELADAEIESNSRTSDTQSPETQRAENPSRDTLESVGSLLAGWPHINEQ